MRTNKKYEDPTYQSFYLSKSVVERAKAKCKAVGIPLSSLINDFLEKWASGGSEDSEAEYERLEQAYVRLLEKSKGLTRQLEELGIVEEMHDLAIELGLDEKGFSNVDEVIAKLMQNYKGPEENLHVFINLLEVAKRRREVGARLSAMRRRKYLSNEGVGVAETIPQTHTLQGAGSVPEMRQQTAQENPRPKVSA